MLSHIVFLIHQLGHNGPQTSEKLMILTVERITTDDSDAFSSSFLCVCGLLFQPREPHF
jgi:hypothetical protein